jgi:CxxC motif-containing protein (DUF1111 family)
VHTNREAGLLAALAVAASGCDGGATGPGSLEDLEAYAGGATTVFEASSNAFSLPAPNLSAATLADHVEGDAAFDRIFVTAPAPHFGGLGPVFNHSSCAGCHVANGRGVESRLHRLSIPGADASGAPLSAPGFGGQIQDRAVIGKSPEARPVLDWIEIVETLHDGTPVALRRPIVTFDDPSAPLPAAALVSSRVGPAVFGLGLLEAVAEEDILAIAREQRASADGISGRPNRVWDIAQQRHVVGRFGWKANEPTLLQQTAHAYQEDMGVTNALFPVESSQGQSAHEDGLADDPEIADAVLDVTTVYVQTLGVPAHRSLQDPQVQAGRDLFESVGCAACHVPRLETGDHELAELSRQTIFPFTDLLLHDMGPGLADGRPDFDATGSEWRTPPLWGVGLLETVNGRLELMHDGRARDFLEAILWHGGEAQPARERFRGLAARDRTALVEFLRSL